jgi:DNA adenine methylase
MEPVSYNRVVPASAEPRPFLKWAGGKRQLLPALRRFYPTSIDQYFEPFLGSGAVFFDLWITGRLRGCPVWLTDFNADLIGCYLQLRDAVDEVIDRLEELSSGHRQCGHTHYYDVRDARFNPARAVWRATGGQAIDYTPGLAAMLIYLNRTGYNGLFRQNAGGGLNVPMGAYSNPRIVDATLLRAVSTVLQDSHVHIAQAPFDVALMRARAGDFVYCDPPYAPVTATANFHAYTARGFQDDDHDRLCALATTLAARGVQVLLSNSIAPRIVGLYDNDAIRRVGLRALRVPARRAINSRPSARGAIEELLVTNINSAECEVRSPEC